MIREKCNLNQFTHFEMSWIFRRARNLGELMDVENARAYNPSDVWYRAYTGPVLVIDDELEMCQ